MPLVTVVIPAFNAAEHIGAAIASILEQTFSDFELLVIDDGSTDDTAKKVETFLRDARVRYYLQTNQGPSAARNYGITLATGEFITCMDADDVSARERLQQQIDIMTADTGIGVCGTWADTIEAVSKRIAPPERNLDIKASLLFDNPFIHSSVMLRGSVLKKVLPAYRAMLAEDYDLWSRLSAHTQFYNIPQPLVKYRVHASQITAHKPAQIVDGAMQVRLHELQQLLGRAPLQPEIEALQRLLEEPRDAALGMQAVLFAAALLAANAVSQHYDQSALREMVLSRLRRLLRSTPRPPISVLLKFGIKNFAMLSQQFGAARTGRLLQWLWRRAR